MQCTWHSGCFPRGKRAAMLRRYPVFFLCAVFSCFRNPPNSNIDYRIFNVRTFLCVRIIHTRVGHTDNESAQHFDSENSHNFCLCSGRDSNLWSWNPLDFKADALPSEPPRPRDKPTDKPTPSSPPTPFPADLHAFYGLVHRLLFQQGHGTSSEPPAGHPGAEDSLRLHRHGGLHQQVQFFAGHLVIISAKKQEGQMLSHITIKTGKYTSMHTQTHNMHACMHTHTHTHKHCTHTNTEHTHTHTHTCMCVNTHPCMHCNTDDTSHTHKHSDIIINMHTHMHAQTHTH